MQNYLSNVIRALLKVYFKCNLGPRFIIHTYYTYICAYLCKKEKDQSKQCVHRRWQDFSWMVGLLVLLLPILSKYFLNRYSESISSGIWNLNEPQQQQWCKQHWGHKRPFLCFVSYRCMTVSFSNSWGLCACCIPSAGAQDWVKYEAQMKLIRDLNVISTSLLPASNRAKRSKAIGMYCIISPAATAACQLAPLITYGIRERAWSVTQLDY